MTAEPTLSELTQRHEANRAFAEEILAIPGVVEQRIRAGDFDTGSVLADFALQRSGMFDQEAAESYAVLEQRIIDAEGEPVLVVTRRSYTVKQTEILKQSLATMHGGAYLGHERTLVPRTVERLSRKSAEHSKRFFLGKIAAGGPRVEGFQPNGLLNPNYLGETESTAGYLTVTDTPSQPWVIPTQAGFEYDVAFDHWDIGKLEDDERLADDLEPKHVRFAGIPVFDFLSDTEPRDGFPSALGRELHSPPHTVNLTAARWLFRETLCTDVLIGQEAINNNGLQAVQDQLEGRTVKPPILRGMD